MNVKFASLVPVVDDVIDPSILTESQTSCDDKLFGIFVGTFMFVGGRIRRSDELVGFIPPVPDDKTFLPFTRLAPVPLLEELDVIGVDVKNPAADNAAVNAAAINGGAIVSGRGINGCRP